MGVIHASQAHQKLVALLQLRADTARIVVTGTQQRGGGRGGATVDETVHLGAPS